MWLMLTATSGSKINVNFDQVVSITKKKAGSGTTITTSIVLNDPVKGDKLKLIGVQNSIESIERVLKSAQVSML